MSYELYWNEMNTFPNIFFLLYKLLKHNAGGSVYNYNSAVVLNFDRCFTEQLG